MQESNIELERQAAADPLSVDIEHLNESGPYVEMVCFVMTLMRRLISSQNLGLGVFKQRSANDDSSSSSSSPGSDDESSSSSEDDSSAESSDDSDRGSKIPTEDFLREIMDSVGAANRPKRPMPKRTRPKIEVLNEPKT